MGETFSRLPALDPLLAESSRSGIRIRLVLRHRDGESRPARLVEGIVLAIASGRDGRVRLRMGIPTGSGDPVEVRVLLDSVDHVERVDATATASGGVVSPTGPHRRATIAFGSDSGIRSCDKALAAHDSSDEVRVENPRKAK
jgi:hypothetical protein